MRGLIFKSVKCWKLRGNVGLQTMTDVSKKRLSEDRAFVRHVVDIFEPFVAKEQRSLLWSNAYLYDKACSMQRSYMLNRSRLIRPSTYMIYCKT